MQASARLSSSAAFRKVIAGVSSATTQSCYRTSRGKAHAAPLPVQEPPLKGRKRVTKQERKIRVVEFVDNYRASNEGKFPTINNTHKQVKGCYYTVRALLQEMKYNHAKSQLVNPKAPPLEGTVKVTEHPMPKDDAEVAQLQGTVQVAEHSTPKDDAEVAQLQGTIQVSEHSMPKDDAEVAQLQETVQVSEHSTPKDVAEVAKLQGTVQVSEHSMPKDDAEVAQLQGTVQVSEHSTPKDDAEVAQLQGTVQVCEHSTPKDDAEVAQVQGTVQVSEHSFPKDEGKVAQCQGTFQFPDLSCGKTVKHDMDTAADSPALSDQTENERMKDRTDNRNPGSKANKFDLKNSEKSMDANASNASDGSGSDLMNEAKTHARDGNPKHEESANTGLLGSLKSFAYGIRNFWKNM